MREIDLRLAALQTDLIDSRCDDAESTYAIKVFVRLFALIITNRITKTEQKPSRLK